MVWSTYLAEGPRGFFGGYGVCLVGSMPANAVYFGMYKLGQRAITDAGIEDVGMAGNAFAGLFAQCGAAFVFTPLDVLKQRLQVSPPGVNVRDVFRAVRRERGRFGLWAGYWAAIAVWGPFSMMYFSSYEALKTTFSSGTSIDTFSLTELAAGTFAAAAGAVVTQPLDFVKTRIQVGRQVVSPVLCPKAVQHVDLISADSRTTRNVLRCFLEIVRSEGPRPMFRGVVARILWLAPGCGIMMCVFEGTQRLLSDSGL
jgi:solute carrier family 25 S-adenosylmethionine transporter 26